MTFYLNTTDNYIKNILKSNEIFYHILRVNSSQMRQGTFDLILLIIIFTFLQAWWIYPIIKKNIYLNKKEEGIKNDIKALERIYKK